MVKEDPAQVLRGVNEMFVRSFFLLALAERKETECRRTCTHCIKDSPEAVAKFNKTSSGVVREGELGRLCLVNKSIYSS